MPLNASTPVYPGDPKVDVKVAAELTKDGYLDHSLKLGTHNGTHVDAPAHMVKDGKNLKDFPLDNFVGNGLVVSKDQGYGVMSMKLDPGDSIIIPQKIERADFFAGVRDFTKWFYEVAVAYAVIHTALR